MQNKYKSVIVFTLIVAISIASIIAANFINNSSKTPIEDDTTSNNISSTNETVKDDIAGDEISTTSEDKNNHVGNLYGDVLQQVLGESNNYETVLGPGNVGAKNPYETDIKIELDGETVTVIFETETTTIEEETTISPNTTVLDTTTIVNEPDTEPVVTTSAANKETTGPISEVETTQQTTPTPETTITPEVEETTGSSDNEKESQPIDNSQSEDSL